MVPMSTSFFRRTTSSTLSTSSQVMSISVRALVVTRNARVLFLKSTVMSFTLPTIVPLLSMTCIPTKRCDATNFGVSFDKLLSLVLRSTFT